MAADICKHCGWLEEYHKGDDKKCPRDHYHRDRDSTFEGRERRRECEQHPHPLYPHITVVTYSELDDE